MRPLFLLSLFSFFAARAFAQSPVATFSHQLTYEGETVTGNFTLHSVRGGQFEVKVQGATGGYTTFTPGPARTYLGTVVGKPGAGAAATRLADGTVWMHVAFEDGTEWFSRGGAVTRYTNVWAPAWPTTAVAPRGGAGSRVYRVEVGIDAGSRFFAEMGNDPALAVAMVEHSVMVSNMSYLRDVGLLNLVGRVVLRGSAAHDLYLVQANALTNTRTEWNTNQPGNLHAVATSIVDFGGGLAYSPSIGTTNNMAWVSFHTGGEFDTVWRHEVGHSWNADDYQGGTPEGTTIMNGNDLARFSGVEQGAIIPYRDTKLGRLTDLGPYSTALPPRATLDLAIGPLNASLTIDVLFNDHDANGNAIALHSFDATSANGGTLLRSAGTGYGGRDRIRYTPAVGFTGLDSFTYRIQDSTGLQSRSHVFVRVEAGGNTAPQFAADPLVLPSGTKESAYAGTLSGQAHDANTADAISWSKVSGPAWLTVAANGTLDGTPSAGDTGAQSFQVQASDGHGGNTQATLKLTVNLDTAFTDLASSLVLHLPLDSDFSDISGHANHATAVGSPAFVPGRIGNAVKLKTATQYLTLGTPADLNFGASTGFTVSFWVKTDEWSGDTPLFTNKNWDSGANIGWIVAAQTDGATWQWNFKGSGGSRADFETGGRITDGQWHHIAVSHTRGGNAVFYHDGAQIGVVALPTGSLDTGLPTVIGRDAALATWGTLEPSMDDVCVWRRALSAVEIAQVAQLGVAGNSAHPFLGQPPVFTANPVIKPTAPEDSAYSATLAGSATGSVSFTKMSGPTWLAVAANGALSGMPANADVGANLFTIRATTTSGLIAEATLSIAVQNVSDAPTFILASMTKSAASVAFPYAGTLAGTATDADVGDTLTFSKLSGPAWLTVAANGTLGGTPTAGDIGANTFTVRVADAANLTATATLTIDVGTALLGGLIAHLPFDGNFNDVSGRAHHGTPGGSPAFASGRIAQAAALDSTAKHVSLGTHGDFQFGASTDFTVALWIKTTSWGSGHDPVIAANKSWTSGGNTGWIIAGQTDGTGWQWNFKGSTGPRADFETGGNIANGQWHHIAVTHTRTGNAVFYQDGAQIGTIPIAASIGTIDDGYPTVIRNDGRLIYEDNAMNATIDDACLWRRALTATEVAQIHTAGIGSATFHTAVQPTLTLSQPAFAPGSAITANFADGTDSALDWVGLFPAGSPSGIGESLLAWRYSDGTTLGSIALRRGAISFPAGLPTTGNYEARYFANDGYTLLASAPFTVSPPLEIWRTQHFGGNSAINGNLHDPDSDGLPNLMEYALALNPNTSTPLSTSFLTDLETVSASQYLRGTLAKNPAATDITITIEVSSDLIVWRTDQLITEAQSSTQLIVRDTVPASPGSPRFLRVKATSP